MPIVVDMHIENQTNTIIETVKKYDPQYFKNNSEEYVRNLLKINILNL